MGLNAAALRLLAEKGLTAADIVELAEALEVRADPTAAERMRRYRANKAAKEAKPVTRNVTDERDGTPTPNEYISNPHVSPDGAKAPCPPSLSERVVSAWNDQAKPAGATGANPLNADRRKALSLRVKEHGEDAVFTAIANIAASPFHCGKNDRGWSANIGWLLKSPENFAKALEMGGGRSAAPSIDMDEYRARMARLEAGGFRPDARLADPQAPPRAGKPVALGELLQRQAGSA